MEKIESSCIIDDDPIAIYGIKKSMKEIDFCTKEVTIYIISSSIDPRDVIKAKDYSLVSNYILKPIKSADLLKLITNRSNA